MSYVGSFWQFSNYIEGIFLVFFSKKTYIFIDQNICWSLLWYLVVFFFNPSFGLNSSVKEMVKKKRVAMGSKMSQESKRIDITVWRRLWNNYLIEFCRRLFGSGYLFQGRDILQIKLLENNYYFSLYKIL